MNVKEVIAALSRYPDNAVVLIESSEGEYGPRQISEQHTHQGEKEPCGIDLPNKFLKGLPVLKT